jgi:hypothetical protein
VKHLTAMHLTMHAMTTAIGIQIPSVDYFANVSAPVAHPFFVEVRYSDLFGSVRGANMA